MTDKMKPHKAVLVYEADPSTGQIKISTEFDPPLEEFENEDQYPMGYYLVAEAADSCIKQIENMSVNLEKMEALSEAKN